jgi:hypothetical protein
VIVTIAALRMMFGVMRLGSSPGPDFHQDAVSFARIREQIAAADHTVQERAAALPPGNLEPADPTVSIAQADRDVQRLCRELPGPSCATARSALEDLRARTSCPEATDRIAVLLGVASDDFTDAATRATLEAVVDDLRGVSARVCGRDPSGSAR